MAKQVVVCASGGLDSSVLLYEYRERVGADAVMAVGVDYGQRHRRELTSLRSICDAAGIDVFVADLRSLVDIMPGSSQTDPSVNVPHGHYADESMRATVVPNRNMMLLSVAGVAAVAHGASTVAYAAHAGDHPIYPDCRPEFASAMAGAFKLAAYEPIELASPFVEIGKHDIVARGKELGAPLGMTWSCYEGGKGHGGLHCGKCGTCVERIEAFDLAGVDDPTEYAE